MSRENLASVRHRYRGEGDDGFTFQDVSLNDIPAIALIKSAECYRYQACEHSEWVSSPSDKWTRNLVISLSLPHLADTQSLYEHLKPQITRMEGFDDAKWGTPTPVVSDASVIANKRHLSR